MHLPHPQRVLRRDERERAGAVDAEAVEGLEVGLDAGAAARVRAGDGERDGGHSIPSHTGSQAAWKKASSSSIARR